MSDEAPRKRTTGLGRGLSSLLGEVSQEAPLSGGGRDSVRMMPVASIEPNPDQPRRSFSDEAIAELAESIAARGLIQPIVVRPHGHRFQIVAGERRWRAAQKARLHEVPVLVREFDDPTTLEVALIENIQRQDLNAIEEAEAYQRLIDDYGHTQEALAKLVHKSRSHVANLLRLLDLPQAIRDHVVAGRLTMGHARALIGADDSEALALEVIRGDLSVRETEKLVRGGRPAARRGPIETKGSSADVEALQRQLGDMLGLNVSIAHKGDGGTVALHYSSLDQLDMICQRLSGEKI
ncbi:ParB/RepB/Spo0J family partition protein [Allosphingosinicella indica]|uniref:Chromosome partitioning protein, ParB family n=1 Tax=Allosphingosinicella indica TaxID=941907 RepID=A0A1X7G4P2_9SPHN|nr:ParB/RepB/Spo0J family partition protein [Allosphingosinicella indica]SMF63847.1 chromosome partitioning protein, ParB family [Allosphingosinicella indica]